MIEGSADTVLPSGRILAPFAYLPSSGLTLERFPRRTASFAEPLLQDANGNLEPVIDQFITELAQSATT